VWWCMAGEIPFSTATQHMLLIVGIVGWEVAPSDSETSTTRWTCKICPTLMKRVAKCRFTVNLLVIDLT
jgi:hypothetical protein